MMTKTTVPSARLRSHPSEVVEVERAVVVQLGSPARTRNVGDFGCQSRLVSNGQNQMFITAPNSKPATAP